MLALMGLLPWTATVTADVCASTARTCCSLTAQQRRKIIGKDITMIFQEPMSSLNPCFTVGFQIGESLRIHLGMNRRNGAARHRTVEPGRHSGAGKAARPVSAPAVRRHEPARDDRHGARLQSETADRRRTDHGARRHHPGADPRPADRSCRRATGWG
jgi:ABC-type dipeptide/oligopeptide/nickel transport system ATPase component